MTTTNPRRQCERLWAANKYLVLQPFEQDLLRNP